MPRTKEVAKARPTHLYGTFALIESASGGHVAYVNVTSIASYLDEIGITSAADKLRHLACEAKLAVALEQVP
jgi:hypothetical protein